MNCDKKNMLNHQKVSKYYEHNYGFDWVNWV